MPDLNRWIQRCVRRVNFGEFLRDAAEWLAVFCFVFGSGVLAVKLRWPMLWPQVLWLIAAAIPLTILAWWWSRRRQWNSRDAVALLDQRLQAGGLLMTLSETHGPAWRDRLPQFERLWQNALPRFRPVRFGRVVVLPIVFAVATCFVPLRNLDEPVAHGAVAQQTMQRLEELMQQLEEAHVLKPDEQESEQLREEMQKLAEETKSKPLTHEKWETVDALQDRLKAKLDRTANMFAQAGDALATLNQALSELDQTGELKLSDEELQRLEGDIQQALQQLANSGALSQLSPGLQRKLGAMAKAGKLKLPRDPAEREALAEELAEHLDRELRKLTELRQQCEACQGGQCDKDGECLYFSLNRGKSDANRPGRGGVTEGRGDAELNFGDKSDSQGLKFKETVLPPGTLDKPRDEVLSVTARAPKIDPTDSAPRGAAREQDATTGNEAWNRQVRPRHKSAVKNYFSDHQTPTK